MKEIKIKSITLHNWRGEKDRTTEFHLDAATYICGDNGLGKSRHFDAFCWLLFGKDSQDRKDFELRTYDGQHNVMHHCECSVEATLAIDGRDVTIKRSYTEQWVKPRGQVEEVLKGNVTECTWDDVPVKVGEFQNRVKEQIIDESVFKMITNPRYFCEKMKWQQQRELLLTMAGVASDEEIAADNKDFRLLLDSLSGKSLTDYRKEVSAEKKRLKKDLGEIKPRIDQTQKMMPEAEDWDALEEQRKAAKDKIVKIDEQLESYESMSSSRRKEVDDINLQISIFRQDQQIAVSRFRQEQLEEVNRKNEGRKEVENFLRNGNTELSQDNMDLSRAKDRVTYLKKEIEKLDSQLAGLWDDWHRISSREQDREHSDICSACGQRLPEDQIKKAHDMFVSRKNADLKLNNERGQSLSNQKKDYQEELTAKEKEVDDLSSAVKGKQDQINVLYDKLNAMPFAKMEDAKAEDVPQYNDLQAKIQQLQDKLAQLSIPTDNSVEKDRLHAERNELNGQVDDLYSRLQKQSQIDSANKEIAVLNDKGKKLSQQIADLEQSEYVAAQFSKKKIENCEKRINSMFQKVTFQLFDYTQDGNEFETCVPLVGGIPYAVANTASQLNAGLDIINTISKFNNITAPIFVDNSESVNEYLVPDNLQMIYLKVTEDQKLIIK